MLVKYSVPAPASRSVSPSRYAEPRTYLYGPSRGNSGRYSRQVCGSTPPSASPLRVPQKPTPPVLLSLSSAARQRERKRNTHRAVDPRVTVQPPDGLGADRLTDDRAQLGAIAHGGHDLLHNRGRKPLLVRDEHHEHAPCADAQRAEREQRGPLALRVGKRGRCERRGFMGSLGRRRVGYGGRG